MSWSTSGPAPGCSGSSPPGSVLHACHAIEHGPIIEAAQAGVAGERHREVVFHRVHSSDFELPERADVILHEQIGEALFDERVVENVAELRDRILKPGGRIFPAHLRLFIEPVEVRADTRAPFAWEQELHGIDFRALEQFGRTQPSSYRQPRFGRSARADAGRPGPW